MGRVYDLSEIIDGARINRLHIRLLAVCWLVLFIDGYDGTAMGFMAPALTKAWSLKPSQLVSIFSLFAVGILIGSLTFGMIGDRFGRRNTLAFATTIFGAFTIAAIFSRSVSELALLRLGAGVGFGGLQPLIYALVAEIAPKDRRIVMVVICTIGFNIGAAMPGLAAAWLIPHFGWTAPFATGGPLSILIGLIVWKWLPESPKFLLLHGRTRELTAAMRQVAPDLAITDQDSFQMSDVAEEGYRGFWPTQLFTGDFKLITPVLWVLYFLSLMTYFFVTSWLPLLLTMAKIPAANAGLFLTVFQLGGLLSLVSVVFKLDRWGARPMIALYGCGIFAIAAIGHAADLPHAGLITLLFFAGACVLCAQQLLNAITSTTYPSAYRSTGTGWALSSGRIGAIVGPTVGGLLIGMQLPLHELYYWVALPYVVAAIASLLLVHLQKVRKSHLRAEAAHSLQR